jgi:hypothetical protein
MSYFDPRFAPTPREPDYISDSVRGEFYDEQENSIFITIEFEYYILEGDYFVTLLSGYQFDPEATEYIVLDYLRITRATFTHG